MQDSHDNHGFVFHAVEDKMFTHRKTVVPRSDVVAIPSNSNILRNYVKGLVQPVQIFLALLNSPGRLRILGDALKVGIRLVGQLKSHLAVQLGRQLLQGIIGNAALLAFNESQL